MRPRYGATFVTLVFDQHIFFVVTVLCETFLMIKRNVSIIYATNISDPAVRGLLSIWIKCKFPTNEKRRYVRKVFCYWLRVFAAINRTHIQLYQGYGPKRREIGALNNIYIYIYILVWFGTPFRVENICICFRCKGKELNSSQEPSLVMWHV